MIFKKGNSENGIFKSILMANFILVIHILLIIGIGFLVLFFRGVVNYLIWILLGGSALIILSIYLFYRRMKKEGKTLGEMLNSPFLRGKTVEVSFLGGLASLKIGREAEAPLQISDTDHHFKMLEDAEAVRIRELNELVHLLEKDLITIDEYNKAKEFIFKG